VNNAFAICRVNICGKVREAPVKMYQWEFNDCCDHKLFFITSFPEPYCPLLLSQSYQSPSTHLPLPDFYKGFLTFSQTFTLKIATAVFAETLENE
jgi:hypothetical protein